MQRVHNSNKQEMKDSLWANFLSSSSFFQKQRRVYWHAYLLMHLSGDLEKDKQKYVMG